MASNLVRWVGVFLAVFGIGRTVQADLFVDNADFENVALGAGGYTYTIAGWQTNNDNGGVPAWITNGYYVDEESTPNSSSLYTTGDPVWQDLGAAFVQGTTYTFTMDIGNLTTATDPTYDWRVFFYNATDADYTAPVAEATGFVTALSVPDAWHRGEAVVQYTATAADDGDTIGIGMGGHVSYYTMYDNAVVIPEPASAALLLLGGAGMLVRARRKRT